MIDYHCHLLPGLDDGPATIEESLAMARSLADFGFREVCCTPHCIKGHYETSPVEVREAVRKLQSRLGYEGVPLTLHAGMEYYLDEYFERFAANLLPLGASRVVLCEAPPQALPGLVAEMANLIVVQGYVPLIAHPERSEVIWKLLEEQEARRKTQDTKVMMQDGRGVEQEPAADDREAKAGRWWRRLFFPFTSHPSADDSPVTVRNAKLSPDTVELPESCLFQANLGSFGGFYGAGPQRRAYELLQRGTYHCIASDLHDPRSATAILEPAREKLAFNPALQKLAAFVAPQGQGGSAQLGFW